MKIDVVLVASSDFGLGRGFYIAKAISQLGLKVTVITNSPIYSPTERNHENPPLDANIKIIDFQIPFAKTLYRSIVGRLIVYIVFSILSFICLLRVTPRPKIFYSRGPHPFTEFLGVLYKQVGRDVKIISDTTDLWPDALEYVGMNSILKRVLIATGHAINHLVYARVDAVVTLNEIMAKVLRERIKSDVYVIYGSIDLDRFRPRNKKDALETLPQEISSVAKEKFVVLYAGIMGTFQDPLVVADIAEQIRNEYRDVLFVVIGSGPLKQKLQNTVQEKSLSNILIFDAVPHELMPFVYNIADLTLLLPPVLSIPGMYGYFVLTLPKKFIEYAACGKPILCVTPTCVSSKLCLEWKAGYHVIPKNIMKVREIIGFLKKSEELRGQLGKNARQMANELFSIESAAAALKKIIDSENFDTT